MDGDPPLRVFVDEEAKPVAVHSPSQVPLHWQQAVKDGLDRDVRLAGPVQWTKEGGKRLHHVHCTSYSLAGETFRGSHAVRRESHNDLRSLKEKKCIFQIKKT